VLDEQAIREEREDQRELDEEHDDLAPRVGRDDVACREDDPREHREHGDR
jgi:hypothetical protein